jgi:hypothetical protein
MLLGIKQARKLFPPRAADNSPSPDALEAQVSLFGFLI